MDQQVSFRLVVLRISTELHVEKFLKRLAGRTDLEDAVKRLDNLTQEEARMALTEMLRITHDVRDEVKVVIEGEQGVFSQSLILSDIHTIRRQGSKVNHPTDGKQRRRNQVFVISYPPRSLLALKPTHRESVNTAPTNMDLSLGSIHKSQHCTKSATRGNGGMVLSRQYLHRVEVYWLALVDPRKTCVPVSIF